MRERAARRANRRQDEEPNSRSTETVSQRTDRNLTAIPPAPSSDSAAAKNNTGLPDPLREGIEHLSGTSLEGVRVHYNSARPAQMQANAYAQGSEIHLAPGQERHLPHEAWHVVQQRQGRVRPTRRVAGHAVNDDSRLEREADIMGKRASSTSSRSS